MTFFNKSLNKKVDELLLDANRVSQSDKLVGQIVNGEQLNLSRNIKIFDKVYKFAEIMAENIQVNILQNLDMIIYSKQQNVQIYGLYINLLVIIILSILMFLVYQDYLLFFGQKFQKK